MATEERSPLLRDGPQGHDENIVSWDGPDDPANPINWTTGQIWGHVAMVSLLTFLVPLGATMFAPATSQALADLGVSSDSAVLAPLVVSVYVLGWTVGPLLSGPLSEARGRRAVYTASNALYVAFTAGCAAAPGAAALVVGRLLAGAAGATPLVIGGGTIADIVPVRRRARALALYMLGPVLGPAIGPLAGGYLADTLGWRSIFWALALAYGCATVAQIVLIRETYPAAILEAKTRRLRRQTGNAALRSALGSGLSGQQVLARAVARPARLTATSLASALLSLISAYVNGVVFVLLTTEPLMLRAEYGFAPRAVGLAFVGYGAGNLCGMAAFTLTSDRPAPQRQQHPAAATATATATAGPEGRLAPAVAAAPLMAAGLLAYGWGAATHAHWALAVAGSAVIGASNVLFFSAVTAYLIDAFGAYAASAIAANVVFRSVGGSLLPLMGGSMYEALGWGWGSSVLAGVALLCMPGLMYLWLSSPKRYDAHT
ncbi:major facilitator superfamily domain-containing protein [Xylariaceae sp. FL0804]|nr:major facilitator superfamily domain-containing protein [Xylariaceae sp. FL0804]